MGNTEMFSIQTFTTDVLVVGSEGTGARASLEAANQGLKILVTSKGFVGKSGSTVTADADIDLDSRSASELLGFPGSMEDSPEIFAADMARESEYIGDQEMVKIHCEEAPRRVQELVEWGAKCYELTQASGHSYPRGVWMPGTGLVKTFVKKFKETPNITLLTLVQNKKLPDRQAPWL